MARTSKSKGSNGSKKAERVYFTLPKNWEIRNAREIGRGKKAVVYFTLYMPGLSLYNLKIVPAGKNYDEFIAMPQISNGKRGKAEEWYNQYAIYLSEDDTSKVIEAVYEALEDDEDDEDEDDEEDEEDEDRTPAGFTKINDETDDDIPF